MLAFVWYIAFAFSIFLKDLITSVTPQVTESATWWQLSMQNHVEIPATADQNLAGNLDVFGFNAPFFFLFFRYFTLS